MKKVLYKKFTDPAQGLKSMSIGQRYQDKESRTYVLKKFVYQVSRSSEVCPEDTPPQMFIKKHFDSKKGIERFNFQVKGCFHLRHKRMLIKVNFQHSLNIKITWKNKDFSPKKSDTLTKKAGS